MKKSSYEAIYATLSAINFDNEEVMNDLRKELNRGSEAKAKKADEYATAKEVVLKTLRETGELMTATEIFIKCEQDLPKGFTKFKVNYGLIHYWMDDVVKVEGKVNSYRTK